MICARCSYRYFPPTSPSLQSAVGSMAGDSVEFLTLIANELVTNSAKYAFAEGVSGEINSRLPGGRRRLAPVGRRQRARRARGVRQPVGKILRAAASSHLGCQAQCEPYLYFRSRYASGCVVRRDDLTLNTVSGDWDSRGSGPEWK